MPPDKDLLHIASKYILQTDEQFAEFIKGCLSDLRAAIEGITATSPVKIHQSTFGKFGFAIYDWTSENLENVSEYAIGLYIANLVNVRADKVEVIGKEKLTNYAANHSQGNDGAVWNDLNRTMQTFLLELVTRRCRYDPGTDDMLLLSIDCDQRVGTTSCGIELRIRNDFQILLTALMNFIKIPFSFHAVCANKDHSEQSRYFSPEKSNDLLRGLWKELRNICMLFYSSSPLEVLPDIEVSVYIYNKHMLSLLKNVLEEDLLIYEEKSRLGRQILRDGKLKSNPDDVPYENRTVPSYRKVKLDENTQYMFTVSKTSMKLFDRVDKYLKSKEPILITGPTGCGKGVLARYIHQNGENSKKHFENRNCSDFNVSNTAHSELFGHVKGAYTDARNDHRGSFELAKDGLLFLDEIGETTNQTQTLILKAIEERRFRRLGDEEDLHFHGRLIAATNIDVSKAIKAGTFREDLLERFTFRIEVPSLRERIDDLPFVLNIETERICRNFNLEPRSWSVLSINKLMEYDWPRNYRQLVNVIRNVIAVVDHKLIRWQAVTNADEEVKKYFNGQSERHQSLIKIAAPDDRFMPSEVSREEFTRLYNDVYHKNASRMARDYPWRKRITSEAIRKWVKKYEL